jgi:hypothetical protein
MMEWFYKLRWRIAGLIIGFNLEDEIDSAYEAGRVYGRSQRFFDEQAK